MKSSFENKWLLLVLAGVLSFAGYEWILAPLINYNERLKTTISSTENIVAELAVLEKRSKELAREIEARGGQVNPTTFNLLSYLQESSDNLGIKPYVKSMRPTQKDIDAVHREESVNLELSKVPLDELLPYLYLLETARDGVWIAQATCHPDALEGMDMELTVSSIVEKDFPQASGRKEKSFAGQKHMRP